MHIALHVGVHCTDDEQILRSLAKNRGELAQRGVLVPKPASYRKQVRDALHEARNSFIGPEHRESLLNEMIGDAPTPDRIVLSNQNFICMHQFALDLGKFYAATVDRLSSFAHIFNLDSIEIFLAIRNPATFIPELFRAGAQQRLMQALSETDPRNYYWSDLIETLREELPNLELTVWCNEDLPFIWEELIRDMAGLEPAYQIEGRHDLLTDIMSPEGFRMFESYLETHDGMTEMQKRRVIAAFLDKFAIQEAVEADLEIDLPGWNDAMIDQMTEQYEEDVFSIQRIPGVRLITP